MIERLSVGSINFNFWVAPDFNAYVKRQYFEWLESVRRKAIYQLEMLRVKRLLKG